MVMPSRRKFLRDAAAASSLLGLNGLSSGLSGAALASQTGRSGAPLRILLLGGTGFLGPHLVHVAQQRGNRISMINRGRREPGHFESDFRNVESIQGDRATAPAYDNLKGKRWVAVIETSGYRHPWTREAVQALKGNVGRYLYVSSTGVFWPYRTVDIAVYGPIPLKDDPPREQPTYGVMKALSENEVRTAFRDNAIIV